MRGEPIRSRSRLGTVGEILRNLRVGWQLFKDRRVPVWLKGIPLLALVYLLWPFDFLADLMPGLGQLDDLTLILLSLVLFITLCPAELVAEHRQSSRALTRVEQPTDDEAIDATFRVVDDEHRK